MVEVLFFCDEQLGPFILISVVVDSLSPCHWEQFVRRASLTALEPLGMLSGKACTISLDVMREPGQGSSHRGAHALGQTRCSDPRGAHAPLPVLLIGVCGGAGAVVVLALPCHRAARGTKRGRERAEVRCSLETDGSFQGPAGRPWSDRP